MYFTILDPLNCLDVVLLIPTQKSTHDQLSAVKLNISLCNKLVVKLLTLILIIASILPTCQIWLSSLHLWQNFWFWRRKNVFMCINSSVASHQKNNDHGRHFLPQQHWIISFLNIILSPLIAELLCSLKKRLYTQSSKCKMFLDIFDQLLI